MDDESLGTRLIRAIGAQDAAALEACFAADAELRALIPSGVRERAGAAEVASVIAAWFGDATELDLVASGVDEIEDRLHISYRFQGVENDAPFVVEQQLYCDLRGGRIERADLLCSGFRPRAARQPSLPVRVAASRTGVPSCSGLGISAIRSERDAIVRYWQHRQPELVAASERYGISRPAPLEPPEHPRNPRTRRREPPSRELDCSQPRASTAPA